MEYLSQKLLIHSELQALNAEKLEKSSTYKNALVLK